MWLFEFFFLFYPFYTVFVWNYGLRFFLITATMGWFFAWLIVVRLAYDELGCNHGILEPHTKECFRNEK